MTTEYKTTTKAVADFYSNQGQRLPDQRVPPPDGENWELVSTAATESVVFYTWRRSV